MAPRESDSIAIMPAGALGVAFFHHLTQGGTSALEKIAFVPREGSESGALLRNARKLRLAVSGEIRQIDEPGIWRPNLLQCAVEGWLPELVLVCTQPDQLLGVIGEAVQLLQWLCEKFAEQEAVNQMPTFILCSNGIYFQRVRQFLVEKLEEGTLFGRLPDLWPRLMPVIVGKLLRGVTIQTGQREGSGADAVYRPGARGRTRLAGGDLYIRERCSAILTRSGGWFEVAESATPTRVEFDKALINLNFNLLGQLCAIDTEGRFHALTVGEILTGESQDEAREVARRVIEIGQAVHAYRTDERFEPIWQELVNSCQEYMKHIPSSLQWIELQLNRGTLQPRLTPTERWLLEPLIRYAHAAGLEDAAQYFESLAHRVEAKLALASEQQKKKAEPERFRL